MYRIEITKAEQITTVTPREWVLGGPDGRGPDGEYGYTQQVTNIKEVNRQVLDMVVPDLDLKEVIAAILENSGEFY